MPKPFKISADDIRTKCLMDRGDYHRDYVIAALERRLDWLKEFSARSPYPWVDVERKQVEKEIGEVQKTIAGIEAELESMGRDADVLEGLHMDAMRDS